MSKQLIRKAIKDLAKPLQPKPKPKTRKRKSRSLLQESPSSYGSLAPIAIDGHLPYFRPIHKTGPGGGYMVCNRELVLPTVTFGTTTGFAITSTVRFNPGLANVVPWLSNIASDYTTYRIHKLSVIWIPIAPSTTQGDVVIFPAYNPQISAPTTELGASSNQDSMIRTVWRPFEQPLDVEAIMTPGPRKYVRSSAVFTDLKTYDGLVLYVGGNNSVNSAGNPIGKLWLYYEVEFFEPVLNTTLSIPSATTIQAYNSAADVFTNGVIGIPGLNVSLDPFGFGTQTGVTFGGTNFNNCYTLPPGWWVFESVFSFLNTTTSAPFYVTGWINQLSTNGTTIGSVGASSGGNTASFSNQVCIVLRISVLSSPNIPGSQYVQLAYNCTFTGGSVQMQPGGGLTISPA